MNNSTLKSRLDTDAEIDVSPQLRKRETELAETIEAIQNIAGSSYWKVLEERIFNGLLETINKKLQEATDEKEMYRLQGQAIWAKKYSDFHSLADAFRVELQMIQKQLGK